MIILDQLSIKHFSKQDLCQFRLGIGAEFVVKRSREVRKYQLMADDIDMFGSSTWLGDRRASNIQGKTNRTRH